MPHGSGLDIASLQPAGLAIGGAFAVVGFFQRAVGFGHDWFAFSGE
jgi:hypothetical protein